MLISTILKNPNKDNTLCKIDNKMSELGKCKLDSIQFGFDYKDSPNDMEYLSLLRDIYIEKLNNNPCLCGTSMDEIKYLVNQATGPIEVKKFSYTSLFEPYVEPEPFVIEVLSDENEFIISDTDGSLIYFPIS